jgi:citrate lyase subunit beta/citryl-CoA lyase
MNGPVHPDKALFAGEARFPAIPACEHYAGNEKLIRKALGLQRELGPIFDVTCDCEDGAPSGRERAHAEMVVSLLASAANGHGMAGVRIHDPEHPHWRGDLDILLEGLGDVLSYITLPKPTSAAQVHTVVDYIATRSARHGIRREIPVHVLIETHGALHEVWEIARVPTVQVLDFGLMDFVSGHHGAIPARAMRSPAQFEHPLLVRAKTEIAAAALANGLVPSHNVCVELNDPEAAFADARRARQEFGYLRMWSIHPTQVRPIVDAMQPDLDEVEDGSAILLEAQRHAWAPIRYRDQLHDRASYRYYWELLRRARITGVALPDTASRAFFPAQPPCAG